MMSRMIMIKETHALDKSFVCLENGKLVYGGDAFK